jgi:hypothetical protein
VQIIIVTIKPYYKKKRLGKTFLAPNTSTSLQTTLAVDAHTAEGQFLHEEQTLINVKSLVLKITLIIIIINF